METSNKLETMEEKKLVWNMALPMIFSLLITSLYYIVDGISWPATARRPLPRHLLPIPCR